MEGKLGLTEDEILESLLREVRAGPRGITAIEVAADRNLSIQKARDLLRPLVHTGKLRIAMVERGPEDGVHWLRRSKVQGYVTA